MFCCKFDQAVGLKKIVISKQFTADYKLVCKFLWSYANDAISMKTFYQAF